MATSKRNSGIRLTDKEMENVKTYIIDVKLQQRALIFAGISYAQFRNMLDNGKGITRRQHTRLMQFCYAIKELKMEF